MAETYHCVEVIADDTDILICLMHHSPDHVNIIMKTKSHCININMLQDAIGASLVKSLLFMQYPGVIPHLPSSELESLKR